MCNQYVISDNQYFGIGIAYLFPSQKCVSLVPEDLIRGLKKITSGVALIYIKDRIKFREVCSYFSSSECELIFFFNTNSGMEMHNLFSTRFWNAKLPVGTLRSRIPNRQSYIDDDILRNISPARREYIFMAAKGFKLYNFGVSSRTGNLKKMHNYRRSLLQALGIFNVSIHNLSLAGLVSLACVTVCKIQCRQRQLNSQSENNGMRFGQNYAGKIPGQMNL